MNKKQKKEFVKQILSNLKKDILERLDKIPENWDGVELRCYIRDYYDSHYLMNRKRKKDYKMIFIP